ncbi:Protein kinase superfamily protein [Zea mays]|uniref:Protein kinase superfamily protein n=1 Tax=Zea mays TaxID=4577 RepID=A0A1D6MPL8_MAIZE|nr:Protein kinase superfamily protein [Zea mays]
MARLGRAGCRSGPARGIPEDTLRNFMSNVLPAVLILEFLSGTNLIVQTFALEVVAPAMPPFQGWGPFHSLASQTKVLVSVSAQPDDGLQRQKKLYSSAVAMSSTHPPISAPSYRYMPGALDLAIYSSDLSRPPVQHTRHLATAAPAHVDADPPDAASNSSAAPLGLVQPPVSPHSAKQRTADAVSTVESLPRPTSTRFLSYEELKVATNNFEPSSVLGEGGFGRVFKGVLGDGTAVAIKKLTNGGHQGDKEFLVEVEMLSRLHHRNLVKLIGYYSSRESSQNLLCYELVPNGSLEAWLHAMGPWPSNLFSEFTFTLYFWPFCRYVAPEYAMTGHLLVKSDVYSYGVVLLELLTGRRPVDMSQPSGQENLVTWARPILRDQDRLGELADPRLGGQYPKDDFVRVCTIAAACVSPEANQRPTMGEVVQSLKMVQRSVEFQESVPTPPARPNVRQSSTTYESDGTSSMFSSGPFSGLSPFETETIPRTAVFSEDLHEGR